MSRYNAPPSNRTATRGRLVLWLALMALLLRALVPAGYMPDARALDAGRFEVTFCTAAGACRAQRGAEHVQDGKPAHDAQTGAQCPFGLLAHLTPAPAFSLNPLSLPADTTPTAQPAQPPCPRQSPTVRRWAPGRHLPWPDPHRPRGPVAARPVEPSDPRFSMRSLILSAPTARHARPIRGGAGCCCPRPAS